MLLCLCFPSHAAAVAIQVLAALRKLDQTGKRKLALQWTRRWHPDTYRRYVLDPDERDKILHRVEEVSKKVNSIIASFDY